ncbi:hypothetical protein MKZ38_000314 [Zalerion maritima]|uniref:Uncharacterized protein n=1 Tax=Zalerion maritima TaxID=339359 RepID=A0AAD5WTU1_9PEZI|nr:hypothetical protein MKZ38_000314 [Zalerion maritima]
MRPAETQRLREHGITMPRPQLQPLRLLGAAGDFRSYMAYWHIPGFHANQRLKDWGLEHARQRTERSHDVFDRQRRRRRREDADESQQGERKSWDQCIWDW